LRWERDPISGLHTKRPPARAPLGNTGEHGAVLRVDLDAIAANYRDLAARARPAQCAAAVKANAYGLGLEPVATTLAEAGCDTFFVAHLAEAQQLRTSLPRVTIYVLGGLLAGTSEIYARANLRPVLGSLGEIDEWRDFAATTGAPAAAVHIDTGFNRLGLDESDVAHLAGNPDRLAGIEIALVMSHLACADTPGHPLNTAQLAAFDEAGARLPGAPASLAGSGGIFLGPAYHFDLVRPGIALFGGAVAGHASRPVARLDATVLQIRDISAGESIGYGATHTFERDSRIAIISLGYADGLLRCLGGADAAGAVFIGDTRAPIVGRISMDLTAIDITGLPAEHVGRGAMVEVIGPHQTIDEIAAAAGTISYEILTSLGSRYTRVYSAANHDL
ncbi:MAG: alanine racemase, partial [Hyphomicrobiales bacterium]